MSKPPKANYGIDAPNVVRNLLVIGLVLLAASAVLPTVPSRAGGIAFGVTALWTGSLCTLEGLLLLLYAKVGKLGHRDRMLAHVDWNGHETVLDIGTGRGLLMIGAAKRLTSGRSIGIDIWSQKDLSSNSMANTLQNAAIEGVADRTEVKGDDATAMTFADDTFDVVLSNLCLHNIPTRDRRDQACREIVRVLKPGGRALISDFKNTARYAEIFRAAGATAIRGGADVLRTFPPLRIVQVDKPARS